MIYNKTPILLFLFLLFPPAVFSDGGMLTRNTLAPEDNSMVWALSIYDIPVPQAETKSIGTDSFTGYQLSFGSFEQSLFLTDTRPFRLFSDINKNYTFEIQEEIAGKPQQSLNPLSVRDERIFYDAGLSIRLGTATVPFVADIRVWWQKNGYYDQIMNKLVRCRTVFEGTLIANGKEFPARLFFLSLDFLFKPYIIVDANRDGFFNPIDDPWFASDRTAILDGSLWTVKTNFTADTAIVSLAPYKGATGTLQLQGEGISQVVLGRRVSGSRLLPEFSIPRLENPTCTLPVGIYAVMRIWLRSKEQTGVVYQWPGEITYKTTYPDLQIETNKTASAYVGAPLTDTLKTIAQNTCGNTWIEYAGCVNQSLYSFVEIKPDDLLRGTALQPATWIMKDRLNRIIDTGKFRRGGVYTEEEESYVRMPFWGYGTYRIERLGSDNELLHRISLEISYYYKQPIIGGLFLVLWLGLSLWLLHIDRADSRSKLWVLLPGILGMSLILVMELIPAYEPFFQVVGTGPLVLTFTLLAYRLVSPTRIIAIFSTSILASLATFFAVNTFFLNFNLIVIELLSLFFALIYLAFYLTVRRRITHRQIIVGSLIVLGISFVVFYILRITIFVGSPVWICPAFIGPFIGFLYLLTLKVPWVRDRFALRIFDLSEMEIGEDKDKPESVA